MEQSGNGRSIFHVRVDGVGRVVIPAGLRQRHQIESGQELVIEDGDGGIRLRTMGEVIQEIQDYCLKFGDPNELWSEELIRERREEAARE